MLGTIALEVSHSLPTAVFASHISGHINLHKVHITGKDVHHQHLCKQNTQTAGRNYGQRG
jgi:hypothetical protein